MCERALDGLECTCTNRHRSALGWKSAVSPSAQPEFSRLKRLDTMGRMSKPARIEAEADEREGLHRRFRLEASNSLAADYTLAQAEGKHIDTGRIMADSVQARVATAEPMQEHIADRSPIHFKHHNNEY